jgi:hypothetical protein
MVSVKTRLVTFLYDKSATIIGCQLLPTAEQLKIIAGNATGLMSGLAEWINKPFPRYQFNCLKNKHLLLHRHAMTSINLQHCV